jgi:indole-3-glycerol phosphate synthase
VRPKHMSRNILDDILETKRKEVRQLVGRTTLSDLQAAALAAPPARNFYAAVTRTPPRRAVNLIGEIKRASPSAGVLREEFDPAALARQYAAAGADALSILTDETYFQGHLDHLKAARAAADLPVLRKDFIIDPHQVYESRAAGADAILLIAAALPTALMLDLAILATELRMTVMVEVHTVEEMLQVRSLVGIPLPRYALLGINNRDLNTFQVDIRTTTRMAELADLGDRKLPVVSESGIQTRSDVQRLAAAGVKAILVGEAFMRQQDIPAAVEELLGPA